MKSLAEAHERGSGFGHGEVRLTVDDIQRLQNGEVLLIGINGNEYTLALASIDKYPTETDSDD